MSVAVDRQMDLMLAELVQGSIQMLMSVVVERRKETVLSRTSKLVEPVQNLWQLERGRSQKHQMDLVLAVLFEKAVVVFENVVVVAGQGLHQMDLMFWLLLKGRSLLIPSTSKRTRRCRCKTCGSRLRKFFPHFAVDPNPPPPKEEAELVFSIGVFGVEPNEVVDVDCCPNGGDTGADV